MEDHHAINGKTWKTHFKLPEGMGLHPIHPPNPAFHRSQVFLDASWMLLSTQPLPRRKKKRQDAGFWKDRPIFLGIASALNGGQ